MATLSLQDRILTLTDGDEVSSVDLSAVKGDKGCRGAQGEPGIILAESGDLATKTYVNNAIAGIDLSPYATKTYVDNKVSGINIGNYYTKAEVDAKIPEDVDLSGYALKTDIPTDAEINALIDAKLGVIENGYYQ